MRIPELLRRVTTGGRDGADPKDLRTEIVRHYREGRLEEAAAAARRLLVWQRETLGEGHPDHATGLINLALLLQKQGKPEEARLLAAQALAIRLQALGPAHPDVAASRRLLESLAEVQVRADRDEPHPEPSDDDREAIQEDSLVLSGELAVIRRPPDSPEPDERQRVLTAFSDAVDETRDQLLRAVRALGDDSALAPAALPAGLADCLARFFDLRDRVMRLSRAEAEDVPDLSLDTPVCWKDLAKPLEIMPPRATRVENAWETRQRALGLLDSVLSLTPRVGAEAPALQPVLNGARSLRGTIATAPLSELPREAFRLARGDHPLALLPRLAALIDTISDDSWEELRIAVTRHFGKPLWAALARGRIVFTELNGNRGSDAAPGERELSTALP
jgi:hypothetical protein